MANRKYNHSRRIKDVQPAMVKSLYPGTIVQFNYIGNKIFDKKPMVLVLWNDYQGYKIHGVNLNYMKDPQIEMLFTLLSKRTTVKLEEESKFLNEKYLRVGIKGFRSPQGIPAKALYKSIIKPRYMKNFDLYRTYDIKKIKALKVINYDLKILNENEQKGTEDEDKL